ncbi:MAG: hypothetical protein RIC55_24645 [Pirellulaceae bacterium]
MNRSPRLWQALEEVPGHSAVVADWRHRLGSEFDVASAFLRPADKYAHSYPDVNDPFSSYNVVRHGDEDIVGVHVNGGKSIALEPQDLLIYRVDQRKLAQSLSVAYGLSFEFSVVHGSPSTHRIGTYRPCAGYTFPVYFTIPLESSTLTQTVYAIRSIAGAAFLLLAPTSRQLRPEAETVMRDVGASFLPLSDAVVCDVQGRLIATPMAIDSLTIFRERHLPALEDSDGVVFFPTPSNARWGDLRIRFVDGHTVAVSVGEVSRTLHYAQMGMANKKNAKPTVRWDLLYSFAKGYGTLAWNHPDANRKNQKRRESLTRDLTRFFRIEGDPIAYDKDGKGWRTLFTIEPDV